MQVVGAAGERLAREPLDSLVGHAVAVGVGQFPDGGRRGDIERAVVPHRSLGEHHLVGEDGPLVEFSVAVAVFQPDDPVGFFRELLLDVVVGAGGVGDIQTSLVVERGRDRAVDQRWPRDPLDRESLGNRERPAVELDLARLAHGREQSATTGTGARCQAIPPMSQSIHVEFPSLRTDVCRDSRLTDDCIHSLR